MLQPAPQEVAADRDPQAAEDAPPRDAEHRPGRLLRWSPYLVAAAFTALYAAYSLSRQARLQTAGYDLGIFTQAVQGYAHLSAPIVPIKGAADFNLLGDHFHPILILLGPVYRLFPSVNTLLVAQAVLIALSIVPVGRLAMDRIGAWAGVPIMVAYGLSWGFQGALGFDFHEIAFAVPLLAFGVKALAEQRWVAAAAWTLPLLLVKEDLGATVAAVGCYLLLRRQWRVGGIVLGTSLAVTALVVLYVIPALNPFGLFRYWNTFGGAEQGGTAGVQWIQLLLDLPANLVTPEQKLNTLFLLAVITAGAALRSPLVLLAVPTLVWRFSSDNPLFWETGTVHYNAILMPIMFIAFVDGVGRLLVSARPLVRGYARAAVPAVLMIALAIVPQFSFRELVTGDAWRPEPRAAAAHQVLDMIPDGARVSATNYLIPQIVDRCRVVIFPRHVNSDLRVDWIVVDSKNLKGVPDPAELQVWNFEQLRQQAGKPRPVYRQVAERDGFYLFHRI